MKSHLFVRDISPEEGNEEPFSIPFGGYLVMYMYVDTGLERPGGWIIQLSPHWEMRFLVMCHSMNTSTDFQKKEKRYIVYTS